MYFTKNEIIELNDNSKYLVIDSAYIDNEAYLAGTWRKGLGIVGNHRD